MGTLYYKKNSTAIWNDVTNWHTDAACTAHAANVPWVSGDSTYLGYDLAYGTGQSDTVTIDAAILATVSGSCVLTCSSESNVNGGTFTGTFTNTLTGSISGGVFLGPTNNAGTIYGGRFTANGIYSTGPIFHGVFSGEGFINGLAIYGGLFTGSGFINGGFIDDGIFMGGSFANYNTITRGYWLLAGRMKVGVTIGTASGDTSPSDNFTNLITDDASTLAVGNVKSGTQYGFHGTQYIGLLWIDR